MTVISKMIGKSFGRLTVQSQATSNARGQAQWNCVCSCGQSKVVLGYLLRNGSVKSCGCLKQPHGHCPKTKRSPTYQSWRSMRERCYLTSHVHFAAYGGRGVTVCDRWYWFENFLADMGERPIGKTLDRYPNPNGNYEPGNCRWATPKQQANNRRTRSD